LCPLLGSNNKKNSKDSWCTKQDIALIFKKSFSASLYSFSFSLRAALLSLQLISELQIASSHPHWKICHTRCILQPDWRENVVSSGLSDK
jgi:hypothetical protein